MRFIEYHGIARRQQVLRAIVFEHQICEEQVVVDHHHFSFHGALAGFHDKALLVARALRAKTIFTRRDRLIPRASAFRHLWQLRAIPSAATIEAAIGKTLDRLNVFDVLTAGETTIGSGDLHVVQADVVGAALQQRRRDRDTERLDDGRNVAVK